MYLLMTFVSQVPVKSSPSLLLDEPLQTYSQNYFVFRLILLAPCYNSDPLAHSGSVGKEPAYSSGDHLQCQRPKFNPWIRKIPGSGEANGNPLQYSCLENPTDRGAWQATVHGVAELDTTQQLNKKAAAAAAKLLQSCSTLCDPIDGSPPGSPVPGILQARTLAWVAISFSNA